MKQNLALIIAALALSLPAVGCKKAGTVAVTTVAAPSGPVELKLKWPVGRRLVQDFGEQDGGEIFVAGVSQSSRQDKSTEQRFAVSVVKERAMDGHETEWKLLSCRMGVTNGADTVLNFDTTQKSPGNPVAGAFQRVVGSKIRCLLDYRGCVEKVDGAEAFRTRLLTGVRGDSAELLKGMYDAGYFQRMLVLSSAQMLPENPVAPGDSWPAQFEIPLENLGSMDMDFTCTLQDWEARDGRYCAHIAMAGTLRFDPGQAGPGVKLSFEDGHCSGEMCFDLDLGAFVESSVQMELKVLVTPPPATHQPSVRFVGTGLYTSHLESVL
jgi:hypothetical protein